METTSGLSDPNKNSPHRNLEGDFDAADDESLPPYPYQVLVSFQYETRPINVKFTYYPEAKLILVNCDCQSPLGARVDSLAGLWDGDDALFPIIEGYVFDFHKVNDV